MLIFFETKIEREHISFFLFSNCICNHIYFFICIILYIFCQLFLFSFFSFSYHYVILFSSKEIYAYKTSPKESLSNTLHEERCRKTNGDNKITSRLSPSADSSRGWKTRRLNSPGQTTRVGRGYNPRRTESKRTSDSEENEPRPSQRARGWRIAGGIGGPVMILRPR